MAKNSLVLELQRLATEGSHDISDLLRKALIVATKLDLKDFRQWIKNELEGYSGNEVPPYRTMHCQMKVMNPYHGLQPLHMPQDMHDALCDIKYRAPISNLMSVIQGHRADRSDPIFPLSETQKQVLMNGMDGPSMEPVRTVSVTQLHVIVDAVRSQILEWALQLEKEGIVGEDMTFSKEEKHRAAVSHNINIANFQGILGDVTQSSVNQELSMTVQANDWRSLEKYLEANGVSTADLKELKTAIDTDPKPAKPNSFGPAVAGWIGKMVGKASSGLWEISVGAGAGLLADAITAYYGG